ncbi:MAG: metal-dependent hydrolase [Salinisphaeraceae bacterium]|nr:metal-dependent hydrolase [Salinisphaeraceae bacterium]
MPQTAKVERRDIHFDLSKIDFLNWHPAGTHVTQLLNALSLLFPDGERFFIDSVRHYEKRITDPKLKQDVKGFIGQEAMHGREHQVYNDALQAAGLPAEEIQAQVVEMLKLGQKTLSPRAQLAITIALEHFTAILADALLSDDRIMADVPEEMAALWRWHAIEETEHKAVAYDVYQEMEGGVWGYAVRCWLMFTVSLDFLYRSYKFQHKMIKAAGAQGDKQGQRNYLKFMFTSPGILRQVFPAWLSYFRPGFHPWKHDNRHHVARWKKAFAAQGSAPGFLDESGKAA